VVPEAFCFQAVHTFSYTGYQMFVSTVSDKPLVKIALLRHCLTCLWNEWTYFNETSHSFIQVYMKLMNFSGSWNSFSLSIGAAIMPADAALPCSKIIIIIIIIIIMHPFLQCKINCPQLCSWQFKQICL